MIDDRASAPLMRFCCWDPCYYYSSDGLGSEEWFLETGFRGCSDPYFRLRSLDAPHTWDCRSISGDVRQRYGGRRPVMFCAKSSIWRCAKCWQCTHKRRGCSSHKCCSSLSYTLASGSISVLCTRLLCFLLQSGKWVVSKTISLECPFLLSYWFR